MYFFRLIFNSFSLIIVGILTLFFPTKLINLLFLGLLLIVTLKLLSNIILMFSSKKYKRVLFYSCITVLVLLSSFLLYKFKATFMPFFAFSLGFFFVLDSLNRIICFILTYKDNLKLAIYYLFSAIFVITICVSLFAFESLHLTSILIAFYCIALGVSYFRDFIVSVSSYKIKWIRPIVLPAIIALFLPYLWYKKLLFCRENSKPIISNIKKDDVEPSLYISIHVGPKIYSRVGHIDLCFDGVTYSFGQYDKDSLSFFKIFGDGVMYSVKERENYYEFVKRIDRKVVIEYGFVLNDKEKELLRKRIDDLIGNSIPWSSPYDYTYAHKLETQVGAKCYKFKSGVLKKYYSTRNNCVLLIDILARGIVVDKLNAGSFIIPGSYLYYFDKQLNVKNSKVICRNIYM